MTNGNTPCISGGYTNMMTDEDSDLIRRSYALDCFHCWVDRYGDVHTPDEMAEYRAIEELPPVEPEIIHCRDCEHYDPGYACCRNNDTFPWSEDDYCSNAERRTDETD